jgi:hypothetical protein
MRAISGDGVRPRRGSSDSVSCSGLARPGSRGERCGDCRGDDVKTRVGAGAAGDTVMGGSGRSMGRARSDGSGPD